ncbi:MAG: hypothetical protein JKY99_02250, partial [Rhizobiales bacterium]|nr:hypothetical protein [Hyphomicrobiales bacterium]
DRLGDRVVAGLEKAHEKLDELMQLAPDAASELQNSLAVLEEKYDARAGENADANGVSADASKRIDEMEASGELDAKLDEINKLTSIAIRFSRLDTDAFIFVDRDKFKTMLLDIQSWTDASSAFSQYMDENAAFLSTSRKANRLMIFSKQLTKEIVTANQNLAEFAKALPQTFDDHLQSVVEMASTAVETERFDVFGPLGGFGDRTIAKEMIWPTNWLAFYEALPAADAGAAKRLQASLTQTIATIDELKESARDKIIANNNLDPDAYVGADRDAILKLVEDGWRTIHGDADILEIRIPSGQWARTIGERWDKVDRMFVRVDFSIIGAYVVEEPVDGIATFWWVEVQKRHLEQDAMISDPASRHRHAPKPDQQIPADKL